MTGRIGLLYGLLDGERGDFLTGYLCGKVPYDTVRVLFSDEEWKLVEAEVLQKFGERDNEVIGEIAVATDGYSIIKSDVGNILAHEEEDGWCFTLCVESPLVGCGKTREKALDNLLETSLLFAEFVFDTEEEMLSQGQASFRRNVSARGGLETWRSAFQKLIKEHLQS
jgi:hypothetical protein